MTHTLATALTGAAGKLTGASDSPRLDANILLCHILDCPRSFLLSHPETPLPAQQAEAFDALIARRCRGEPVAYITGVKEFWSLELNVTPDVLVPRPETETLVEAALDRIPAATHASVADLGTGSGAIAIALAIERPGIRVLATDASPAALSVAQKNAQRHDVTNVQFRAGSWYAPMGDESFDMIVSNPPYIAEGDPHLAALAHEPRSALVAPQAGLAALQQIITGAPAHLTTGGWLLVEHGADQADAVSGLFAAAGFSDIRTLPDLAGLPRVSFGQLLHSAA